MLVEGNIFIKLFTKNYTIIDQYCNNLGLKKYVYIYINFKKCKYLKYIYTLCTLGCLNIY